MQTFLEFTRQNFTKHTMSDDLMSRFYTCLNLRLESKIVALTKIIDQSGPNKELQALFPQLINNIFCSSFGNGWNLKTITCDYNKGNQYEFQAIINFLEPMGPMFRLCYKLLSDPQLKYDLPLNLLPLDLRMCLEQGRCPQYYADMLIMDSQTLNVIALALNPFDYYIFNFAIHLVNNSQQQTMWEEWNSAYFALACDYLMHFLPSDPNMAVLPHIPQYTGKAAMAAPLQTANRPLHMPSLLLKPDVCGMNNQHSSSQTQSRNEVWRTETVLQVFIDIWMSVEPFNPREIGLSQINYTTTCSSPERVRIVRVLVKHIHAYTTKHLSSQTRRSSTLAKYGRQVMCTRAYHYVRHLVMTWPLDASFRLVLELWLSLIQPWRYTDNTINQDRFPGSRNNQEETNNNVLDSSFTQFIAENFPTYTNIFQLMLPRFMRMDLTAYKNAVMLFRLGKVFSQQHLVQILWNLEQAITDSVSGYHSPESSFNHSAYDESFTYNGIALSKYVPVAKQAISEFNLSPNFEYEPVWSESKTTFALEFVRKIQVAKFAAERIVEEQSRLTLQNQGTWSRIKHWLMIGGTDDKEIALQECKKVPVYLNSCIHYFSNIFGLQENSLMTTQESFQGDGFSENSSFANSMTFAQSITHKLRKPPTSVQYMGDPDLMPITSYESTILVRIMYHISSKLNEMYQDEFSRLWNSNSLWGFIAREILQPPCTIRTYAKDATNRQRVVTQNLPARLSLRRLGSHAFVFWVSVGYVIFRLLSYGGFFYTFFLISVWMIYVVIKASLKMLHVLSA